MIALGQGRGPPPTPLGRRGRTQAPSTSPNAERMNSGAYNHSMPSLRPQHRPPFTPPRLADAFARPPCGAPSAVRVLSRSSIGRWVAVWWLERLGPSWVRRGHSNRPTGLHGSLLNSGVGHDTAAAPNSLPTNQVEALVRIPISMTASLPSEWVLGRPPDQDDSLPLVAVGGAASCLVWVC